MLLLQHDCLLLISICHGNNLKLVHVTLRMMKFTLKEWARQLVLDVYEGWRLDPLTQEMCHHDLWIFYLLALLRIHNFSIAANAVEETQAETFPTHGIFTQLACTPICSHMSQTESSVTTELIPASGGERHPAVQMILPETLYWWVKQVLFRTQGSDWSRSGQGGSCDDAGGRRICLVLFLDVW